MIFVKLKNPLLLLRCCKAITICCFQKLLCEVPRCMCSINAGSLLSPWLPCLLTCMWNQASLHRALKVARTNLLYSVSQCFSLCILSKQTVAGQMSCLGHFAPLHACTLEHCVLTCHFQKTSAWVFLDGFWEPEWRQNLHLALYLH